MPFFNFNRGDGLLLQLSLKANPRHLHQSNGSPPLIFNKWNGSTIGRSSILQNILKWKTRINQSHMTLGTCF